MFERGKLTDHACTGYRGALQPNRPAMLGVWTNGWKGRDERLQDLATIGLAPFHRPSSSIENMNAAFPDSGDLTEAELQALPPFVRNFKCQGQIEKVRLCIYRESGWNV